jgi:hypothetical protein
MNPTHGARARRGAGNEPKRKRAREEGSQPSMADASGEHVEAQELKPLCVEEAIKWRDMADNEHALAASELALGNDSYAARILAHADEMDAVAAKSLDVSTHTPGPVTIGPGGEVGLLTPQTSTPTTIDTVREHPGMITARASHLRLSLADQAEALTPAVDAAETIQARDSLEKMLAHQLAATHRLGMRFIAEADGLLGKIRTWTPGKAMDRGPTGRWEFTNRTEQAASIEASRLANSAARMFSTYQEGWLTLARIRRGGGQTVKVIHQHVAVGAGGQAVVAGNMKAGGQRAKRRGGRVRK